MLLLVVLGKYKFQFCMNLWSLQCSCAENLLCFNKKSNVAT